jgi:hypothetical protein
MRRSQVRTLPEPAVRALAKAGDAISFLHLPLNSVRLENMRADTSQIPIDSIQRLAPELPYSQADGVDKTVAWMRREQLIY